MPRNQFEHKIGAQGFISRSIEYKIGNNRKIVLAYEVEEMWLVLRWSGLGFFAVRKELFLLSGNDRTAIMITTVSTGLEKLAKLSRIQ